MKRSNSGFQESRYQAKLILVKLQKREEDVPEKVRKKLTEFMVESPPVLEHYCKQNKLVEVDASASLAVVRSRVKAIAASLIANPQLGATPPLRAQGFSSAELPFGLEILSESCRREKLWTTTALAS